MSRNRKEGRYAGKTNGKHVRACNSQMAITIETRKGRLYIVPKVPESNTAWSVMRIRAAEHLVKHGCCSII